MEVDLNTAEQVAQTPQPTLTDSDSSMAPRAPNRNDVAAAFERRMRQQHAEAATHASNYVAFDEHHEQRQKFRRMVDPGILRPNPRPVALEAINILLQLSENIIKNPDNVKFHRFKPTNAKIKQYLVDPKGTLEYAVEMGFRPEVENFQPYYVFNKRKLADLQTGHTVLKELLEQEQAKEEAAAIAKQREKAVAAAAVAKVKQAFLDDRKSKELHDRREKEVRDARPSRQSSVSAPAPSTPQRLTRRQGTMPGAGQTLSGDTPSPPPAYPDVNDNDSDED